MSTTYCFPLLFMLVLLLNFNAVQMQDNNGVNIARLPRSVSSCTRTVVSNEHSKEFKVEQDSFYVMPSQNFESLKFKMILKEMHITKFRSPESVEFDNSDVVPGQWHRIKVDYVKKVVAMAGDQHTLTITIGEHTKVLDVGYDRWFNGFVGFVLEASGGMEILYNCSPEEAEERMPRASVAHVMDRAVGTGSGSNWKLGITLGVTALLVVIVVGVAGTVSLRAYRNLEHIDARRQSQVSRRCSQVSRTCLPAPLVMRDMTDGEQRRLSDDIYEELDETAFEKFRQNMGAPQSSSGFSMEHTVTQVGNCSRESTATPDDICFQKSKITPENQSEPLFIRTPRKYSTEISAHTGRRNNHYVDVTSFLHMKNYIGEC